MRGSQGGSKGRLGRGVTWGQTTGTEGLGQGMTVVWGGFGHSVGRSYISQVCRREESWVKTYLCVDWRQDVCGEARGGPRDGWGGGGPGVRPPKTHDFPLKTLFLGQITVCYLVKKHGF